MRIPQEDITGDAVLEGASIASYRVLKGAHLHVKGLMQGSVLVETGGLLTVSGTLQGSLTVRPGGAARVGGSLHGSVIVETGGTLHIHRGGIGAGSAINRGEILVEGRWAGPSTGGGVIRVWPDGKVQLAGV